MRLISRKAPWLTGAVLLAITGYLWLRPSDEERSTTEQPKTTAAASASLGAEARVLATQGPVPRPAPSAEPELGNAETARQRFKQVMHSDNPYPEFIAAWQSKTFQGFAIARRVAELCRYVKAITTPEEQARRLEARGIRIHHPGSPQQQAQAAQLLKSRCESVLADSLRTSEPVAGDDNAHLYLQLQGARLGGPQPGIELAFGYLLPQDMLAMLTSNLNAKTGEAQSPQYLNGKLWGGASTPLAYERALYIAIWSLQTEPSRLSSSLFYLVQCAVDAVCTEDIGEMMLADLAPDSKAKAEALILYPQIKRAIEQADYKAFLRPGKQ